MLDLLYNSLFIAIIIAWILFHRPGHRYIIDLLVRHRKAVFLIAWLLFISLLAIFITFFDYFEASHDIDDAIQAATDHFADGGNPYSDQVVPRFPEKYYGSSRELVNGTYNYLPLDLLVYSGIRQVLSPLGSPYWFVASNAIFAGIASYLYWRAIKLDLLLFFPVSASVFFVFSFDNICLTAVFVSAGLMYLYHPERTKCYLLLALLLFGLASLTKTFAVIIPLVIALAYLQSAIRRKDRRFALHIASCLIALLAIAIIIALPFGIGSVLDSAVFFHIDPEMRLNTSAGGTLLSYFFGTSSLFIPLSVGSMVVAIIVSLKFRDLLDRIIAVESVFLAVLITSSHSALLLPSMFLLLGFVIQNMRLDDLSSGSAHSRRRE